MQVTILPSGPVLNSHYRSFVANEALLRRSSPYGTATGAGGSLATAESVATRIRSSSSNCSSSSSSSTSTSIRSSSPCSQTYSGSRGRSSHEAGLSSSPPVGTTMSDEEARVWEAYCGLGSRSSRKRALSQMTESDRVAHGHGQNTHSDEESGEQSALGERETKRRRSGGRPLPCQGGDLGEDTCSEGPVLLREAAARAKQVSERFASWAALGELLSAPQTELVVAGGDGGGKPLSEEDLLNRRVYVKSETLIRAFGTSFVLPAQSAFVQSDLSRLSAALLRPTEGEHGGGSDVDVDGGVDGGGRQGSDREEGRPPNRSCGEGGGEAAATSGGRAPSISPAPAFSCPFTTVLMDPPWPSHSVSRSRSYATAASASALLGALALPRLLSGGGGPAPSEGALVAVWVTNNPAVTQAVLRTFKRDWSVSYLTTWYWLKVYRRRSRVSGEGEEGGDVQGRGCDVDVVESGDVGGKGKSVEEGRGESREGASEDESLEDTESARSQGNDANGTAHDEAHSECSSKGSADTFADSEDGSEIEPEWVPVLPFGRSNRKPYEKLILGWRFPPGNNPPGALPLLSPCLTDVFPESARRERLILCEPSSHSRKPLVHALLTDLSSQVRAFLSSSHASSSRAPSTIASDCGGAREGGEGGWSPGEGEGLELFARHLTPGWTAWGNETLLFQSLDNFHLRIAKGPS